jgi:hypothetical protein
MEGAKQARGNSPWHGPKVLKVHLFHSPLNCTEVLMAMLTTTADPIVRLSNIGTSLPREELCPKRAMHCDPSSIFRNALAPLSAGLVGPLGSWTFSLPGVGRALLGWWR